MGQATETVRTGGRQRQMWTVGRSCNETGRRPADRGRQADRRDLEKMREMVEVGRQVPTELCLQFWSHLCDA